MKKKTSSEVVVGISKMSLADIALVVAHDWNKVYFGAVPYLRAMQCLVNVDQDYGLESGKSVVAYFLANASTWRGEVAKCVKKELNKRLK